MTREEAQRYEYHVMGAKTQQGLASEMNERAREGWEPIIAYQEVEAGKRHVAVFRRAKP